MTVYEKLSYKDFTNKDISPMDLSDFQEGMIIAGSTFYIEDDGTNKIKLKDIFGNKLKKPIFKNCNLDNIKIPTSATVIDCSNRRIVKQADGDDWECDKDDDTPVKPLNWKWRKRFGISIDPAEIVNTPSDYMREKLKKQKKGAV